jgi:hypothetical protein
LQQHLKIPQRAETLNNGQDLRSQSEQENLTIVRTRYTKKSQGYGQSKMKKIVMILVAVIGFLGISNSVSAQQRTKIADGIYLVNYGGATYGIENDNTKQCVNLSVKQQKTSAGAVVYDVFCGNKYTKGLAKTGLASGILAALTAVGQPWLAPFVGVVANNIYDDVCHHFGEKK